MLIIQLATNDWRKSNPNTVIEETNTIIEEKDPAIQELEMANIGEFLNYSKLPVQ